MEILPELETTRQVIAAVEKYLGTEPRTAAGQAAVLLNRPADLWWVGDLGNRHPPGGRFRSLRGSKSLTRR